MQEQRRHPRYPLQPGSYAYYALGYAALRDISLGGVYVEDRANQFTPGSELDLELRLGEEILALRGAVRRADPNTGFSFEFLDLPAAARRRLQAYFRTKLGAPERA